MVSITYNVSDSLIFSNYYLLIAKMFPMFLDIKVNINYKLYYSMYYVPSSYVVGHVLWKYFAFTMLPPYCIYSIMFTIVHVNASFYRYFIEFPNRWYHNQWHLKNTIVSAYTMTNGFQNVMLLLMLYCL